MATRKPETQTVTIKGEDYEAEENVTPRMAALAAHPFHTGGYGKTKYPTSWVVRYMGRLRRIYSDCHSNVGVTYVMVAGQKHYVS